MRFDIHTSYYSSDHDEWFPWIVIDGNMYVFSHYNKECYQVRGPYWYGGLVKRDGLEEWKERMGFNESVAILSTGGHQHAIGQPCPDCEIKKEELLSMGAVELCSNPHNIAVGRGIACWCQEMKEIREGKRGPNDFSSWPSFCEECKPDTKWVRFYDKNDEIWWEYPQKEKEEHFSCDHPSYMICPTCIWYPDIEKEKEMTKEKSATELLEEGRKYREDLKLKADNGCLNSLFDLAHSYKDGILINPTNDGKPIYLEKDEKKYLELILQIYEKDKEFNHSPYTVKIPYYIAHAYEKGIGTEIDCLKAFKFWEEISLTKNSNDMFDVVKWLMKEDFIKANADRINKILQERKDKRENETHS